MCQSDLIRVHQMSVGAHFSQCSWIQGTGQALCAVLMHGRWISDMRRLGIHWIGLSGCQNWDCKDWRLMEILWECGKRYRYQILFAIAMQNCKKMTDWETFNIIILVKTTASRNAGTYMYIILDLCIYSILFYSILFYVKRTLMTYPGWEPAEPGSLWEHPWLWLRRQWWQKQSNPACPGRWVLVVEVQICDAM